MLKFPQSRVSSEVVDFDISFLPPGGKKKSLQLLIDFHGNSPISPSLRSSF